MCTTKKKIHTVYSYVDMSFQRYNYALRTCDSSHFPTMLCCVIAVHAYRFEVTQCKGVDS